MFPFFVVTLRILSHLFKHSLKFSNVLTFLMKNRRTLECFIFMLPSHFTIRCFSSVFFHTMLCVCGCVYAYACVWCIAFSILLAYHSFLHFSLSFWNYFLFCCIASFISSFIDDPGGGNLSQGLVILKCFIFHFLKIILSDVKQSLLLQNGVVLIWEILKIVFKPSIISPLSNIVMILTLG